MAQKTKEIVAVYQQFREKTDDKGRVITNEFVRLYGWFLLDEGKQALLEQDVPKWDREEINDLDVLANRLGYHLYRMNLTEESIGNLPLLGTDPCFSAEGSIKGYGENTTVYVIPLSENRLRYVKSRTSERIKELQE